MVGWFRSVRHKCRHFLKENNPVKKVELLKIDEYFTDFNIAITCHEAVFENIGWPCCVQRSEKIQA